MALLTCVFFPVFFPRTSCCQRPRWRPRSPSAWPSPPASSPRARSPVRRARGIYARVGVRNACAYGGGKRIRISCAWRGGGICARAGAGSRRALRGEEGMRARAGVTNATVRAQRACGWVESGAAGGQIWRPTGVPVGGGGGTWIHGEGGKTWKKTWKKGGKKVRGKKKVKKKWKKSWEKKKVKKSCWGDERAVPSTCAHRLPPMRLGSPKWSNWSKAVKLEAARPNMEPRKRAVSHPPAPTGAGAPRASGESRRRRAKRPVFGPAGRAPP